MSEILQDMIKMIAPNVIAHVVVLVLIIVIIKRLLLGDTMNAVSRITQVEDEVRTKEEGNRREIDEHEREFEKTKLEAEQELNVQRVAAEKELSTVRDQITADAQKEAEAIKAEAQKQIEASLKEKIEGLKSQLRGIARLLHEEVLSQFESAKQRAAAFEVEFEQKLSELARQDDQTSVKEDNGDDTGVNSEVIVKAVAQAHAEDASDTSKADETAQVTEMASKAADYEEWVELEILPPKDQGDIDRLKTYLDGLAEVRTTEIISLSEKTLVEVCLSKPIDLLETLHGLSQVKQAKEIEDGEQRKIQIVLSTYTNLEASKDALRNKAHDIFSGRR